MISWLKKKKKKKKKKAKQNKAESKSWKGTIIKE